MNLKKTGSPYWKYFLTFENAPSLHDIFLWTAEKQCNSVLKMEALYLPRHRRAGQERQIPYVVTFVLFKDAIDAYHVINKFVYTK